MNNPVPLEYVTSFAQTNQALMQHLATALLTGSDNGANFQNYAEVAQAQQGYLQQMSTLWLGVMMEAVPSPIQPSKGDRRFTGEEWRKSSLHSFLKDSYLINTRFVNDLIERSSVDEKTRGRMQILCAANTRCPEPFQLPRHQSAITSACPGNGRRQPGVRYQEPD